jgi:Ca2+-binding RTX toxin-like protein
MYWKNGQQSNGTYPALFASEFSDFDFDGANTGRWFSPPDALAGIATPGAITVPTSTSLFPTVADDVPDDTSSTRTLSINGAHIVSTLNAPGDWDFFKVELQAGQSYEFAQYAKVGGPTGVPLADAFLEIRDAAGNLLQTADGGGRTTGGQAYGTDALLTFSPTVSGTYYVNARAFDQDATDGTRGEVVGDYEIFATVSTYRPYYNVDSPLHSIDWGSQVDRTSRNPDGEEGPRETGNDYTGTAWNPFGIQGKNVITYYFAKQGEIFIDEDPTTPGTTDTMVAKGFAQWEMDAYQGAFGAYSKVADLVYVEVQDRTAADFILITYDGTPGDVGPSLLGRMSPPGEENEGRTEFNANDVRWTPEGLAPGGFSFTTLIHELGHGHGLAHPHDNGGRSSVMRGVEEEGVVADYTNGDFDLNQSIHTMMSYEDGWEKSPYGQAETTDGFGWLGGLMAFDIAAIQDKYGVNEEWKRGDDYYILKDENAPGTYYECIWDAGGIDQIAYDGTRDTTIDLRPATLQYEYGGGGWISYAYGVFGGFTIANGVNIENATSGSGNDTLTGNDVANVLNASSGDDVISGNGGDDTLIGGLGHDVMSGGEGRDLFLYVSALDSVVGGGRDEILDFEQGQDKIDLTGIGANAFIGSSAFDSVAGQVRFAAFDGMTIVEFDRNGDGRADLQIQLDDNVWLTAGDFLGLDTMPVGADGFMF